MLSGLGHDSCAKAVQEGLVGPGACGVDNETAAWQPGCRRVRAPWLPHATPGEVAHGQVGACLLAVAAEALVERPVVERAGCHAAVAVAAQLLEQARATGQILRPL